jgi:hypothetical protein
MIKNMIVKHGLRLEKANLRKVGWDERLLLSSVFGCLERFTAYVFLVYVFQPRIEFG